MIRRTPLVAIPAVQERIGPVLLKLENLQRTGSFKLRGALCKLASLSRTERQRGVITASAGNHGSGIALAASQMGIEVTVLVSDNTPRVKRDLIASLGARVVVAGANFEEADTKAKARASASGAFYISSYDDDEIIEGNGGTLADEIVEQAPNVSQVVCSVGGGGMISGLALRLAPRGIKVIGVEPENNCAMYESLEGDKALVEYHGKPTLAEGLEGPVAERTFAITREHVEHIARVSEAGIRRAVGFSYRVVGTIVECSGAVALAGFMENVVAPAATGATVCILSGGNIEPELLDEILADPLAT